VTVARENEADRRPSSSPSGSFAPTSGVLFSNIAHKLIVTVVTAASTFSVRTLDGITTSLGSLPVGTYVFDVQCDTYTAGTPGNVTVAAFYHVN
jgi:hypothetical protein